MVKHMSELYIKRKKERMKNAIESGQLSPDQQYDLIEYTIDDLLNTNPVSINEEAVKEHDKKIKELTEQMNDLQKKISEQYIKTYNKLLEEI